MKYYVLRLCESLAHLCPRRVAYGFARRFAELYWLLDHRARKAVMANLQTIHAHGQMILSERALRLLAREIFLNFAKYLVDFFHFLHIRDDQVRRLIHFDNTLDTLNDLKARGKGLIVISAHLGNWELGAAALTALDYPIHAVALWHPDHKLNELYQRQRMARRIRAIPMGRAARECIAALRRNQIVALVGDRDFTGSRQTTIFFGKPARLPTGPAKLALATGAPILPIFMVRLPDDTFRYVLEPAIFPDKKTDTVETIMAQIAHALEHVIRQHSEQWYLFHHLWDTERDRDLAAATAFAKTDPAPPNTP